MIKELYKDGYTQNREISWLRFNERCLNEAKDPTVPLLERIKFVAIFSSNLNEFFSVRVGSLIEMDRVSKTRIDNKTGLTAKGQLKEIYSLAEKLCKKREIIYSDIRKQLKLAGIADLQISECTKEEKTYLKKYYRDKVRMYLGAQIVDAQHPVPVFRSDIIYCAGILNYGGKEMFALVSIPDNLPKIVVLPSKKEHRFIHMEDLVLDNIASLFSGSTLVDGIKFSIVRSADVTIEDDDKDYRERMSDMLKKRRHSGIVRIEVSKKPSVAMKKYLYSKIKVANNIECVTSMPLDRKYMFAVAPERSELLYPPYTPKLSDKLDYSKPIFEQVLDHEVLMNYPFESMDPFVALVKQAADDPEVTAIRLTIYRLAKRSRLVNYLCRAAENGKNVEILIELKARFDEQHNIDYSERLIDAGCNVIFGFEKYKVHSKICLISRRKSDKVERVALLATGNFNESTSKSYTDLAYMTANPRITEDCIKFFQSMMIGKLDSHYNNLLVSPVSLKKRVLELMDREIAKGENGRIIIKMNSLTDEEIIAKMSEASNAGVKIDMIIRGICCILPGVKGKTENITVRSIVGRYLEHSRVYIFGKGSSEKMYISSADFMTRNTERRVEIACPILDSASRKYIHDYLAVCFADTAKARIMGPKGKYRKISSGEYISCQDELMKSTKGETIDILPSANTKTIKVFNTEYSPK